MNINFKKYPDGLVPSIIQDVRTRKVLMLGFMNAESLELTKSTGNVTFHSRSRNAIWTKGETSGNFLRVCDILLDCDSDALLVKVEPAGHVCHTGGDTCFGEKNEHGSSLFRLQETVVDRKENPKEGSYTSGLFAEGLNRIAQKVGEEAVELIIEAKDADDDRFKSEAADLIYHLLVLFAAKGTSLEEVELVLASRSN